jgi:hypothetical protein
MYGSQDPLVVQDGGREGDRVSELVGEVKWVPNGEVIDSRSQARLVRGREGGGLSPSPPQKGEGLDVGIFGLEHVQPPWRSPPKMRRWCGSVTGSRAKAWRAISGSYTA